MQFYKKKKLQNELKGVLQSILQEITGKKILGTSDPAYYIRDWQIFGDKEQFDGNIQKETDKDKKKYLLKLQEVA